MLVLHYRFAPSQWETALHCNDVSHWLGASLESALWHILRPEQNGRHFVYDIFRCVLLNDKLDTTCFNFCCQVCFGGSTWWYWPTTMGSADGLVLNIIIRHFVVMNFMGLTGWVLGAHSQNLQERSHVWCFWWYWIWDILPFILIRLT